MQIRRPDEPIDGVIFDMDGTLIDSEAVVRQCMARAIAPFGRELEDAFFHQLIGLPIDRTRRMIADYCGEAFDEAAYVARMEAAVEDMTADGIPLKAGAMEIVHFLSAENVPLALATSSSRAAVDRHFARHGLLDHFNAIRTRDDVENGKPHPDLIFAAAEALKLPPARCLVIEDSYNGVRAAHAAGAPVVMVPDMVLPSAEIEALCHWIADHLGEVHGWLEDMRPCK